MSTREHRKMLKKMKFISDQEGIMTRYLREREHWSSHIQHCRDFINGAFKDPAIRTVAVMGSGWLLDLPLDQLSERFEKILLVDIHHPPQVRKKVEAYANVKMQEVDITGGGIAFAWDLGNMTGGKIDVSSLNSFDPEIPELNIDPDAIISLNILNQLDILIVDFLKARDPGINDEDLATLRHIIQQFHIEWITQKSGCLISDIVEENQSPQGEVIQHDLLHADLPVSSRSEEWTWDFDLSGNYHRDRITKMKVQALEW